MNDGVPPVAAFRLAAYDIVSGHGVATVYLRGGAVLKGRVDKDFSFGPTLFLRTDEGWHVIDYAEIAALNGEPSS